MKQTDSFLLWRRHGTGLDNVWLGSVWPVTKRARSQVLHGPATACGDSDHPLHHIIKSL
jgi:hypothetical protein